MSESTTNFVGLDVHKNFIQVAVLQSEEAPAMEWRVPNTEPKVRGLLKKLRRVCGGSVEACYEAGPTGYALYRTLNSGQGIRCRVIAPSLIPRKAGERVKTDRRDAKKLAEYLSAGLLTEVQPPSLEDEARRELCRARSTAKDDQKKAKQRLSKFLLRQGRVFRGGKVPWTKKHMIWLEQQRFENAHLQLAFDSLMRALTQTKDRVRELDAAIEVAAQDEAVREPVALLKCFKGIQTTTAMSIVTELYSFERFRSPRSLMAFLGMTPSEHSSGGQVSKGAITTAGNSRLRKLLTEAAWNYTRTNKTGYALRRRREGQPGWAIDVAEKAQSRLNRRYRALLWRGKHHNKAVTAIARELAGFIWVVLARHLAMAQGADD